MVPRRAVLMRNVIRRQKLCEFSHGCEFMFTVLLSLYSIMR